MQHPSPGLSSPSALFVGSRSSPLINSGYDQSTDGVGSLFSPTDLIRLHDDFVRFPLDHEQQAPPLKLSRAMEGLGQATRHIADIRTGADLVLEALEIAIGKDASKKSRDCMPAAVEHVKKALQNLRAVGRDLESSGILRGAQQRYEDHQPWGLQPPTVCPDGQVTPYAWKRQIAGQAAASAVDRTRIALKSFMEQKKRFFPTISEDRCVSGKLRRTGHRDAEDTSLADVLGRIQVDAPGMVVIPYVRMEWGKRISNVNMSKVVPDPSQALASLSPQALTPFKIDSISGEGNDSSRPVERVSILEVGISGVFRAIISLLPAGSVSPDAIAIFSPDETGGHVNAWGLSQNKLHQRISEQAVSALHFFRRQKHESALEHLLHWIYSFRTLFTQSCMECKRIITLDAPSDLLLPPLVRLYHLPAKLSFSNKPDEGGPGAFHIGCVPRKDKEVS